MCHVLVIEDEWLLAEHVCDIAMRAGATSVVTAECEIDAVEAATLRKPDIILSDVMLISGTGPHAVETIIARNGATPVIFITGTPEACKPCAPPAVIFGKPIDERAVIAAFRELAPV